MHWGRFGIRVCERRGGLSERSSGVVLVVSQISGGDGVCVCVCCGCGWAWVGVGVGGGSFGLLPFSSG